MELVCEERDDEQKKWVDEENGLVCSTLTADWKAPALPARQVGQKGQCQVRVRLCGQERPVANCPKCPATMPRQAAAACEGCLKY